MTIQQTYEYVVKNEIAIDTRKAPAIASLRWIELENISGGVSGRVPHRSTPSLAAHGPCGTRLLGQHRQRPLEEPRGALAGRRWAVPGVLDGGLPPAGSINQ
jgi:hypothetical protein